MHDQSDTDYNRPSAQPLVLEIKDIGTYSTADTDFADTLGWQCHGYLVKRVRMTVADRRMSSKPSPIPLQAWSLGGQLKVFPLA